MNWVDFKIVMSGTGFVGFIYIGVMFNTPWCFIVAFTSLFLFVKEVNKP